MSRNTTLYPEAIILNRIGLVTAILLLLLTGFTYFEDVNWVFSIVAHFREWLLALSILALAFSFWLTKNKTLISLIFVLSGLSHLWFVFPHWGLQRKAPESLSNPSEKTQVFFANLNSRNTRHEVLIQHIRESKPDLVLLVEVTDAWVEQLKKLESIYSHSKIIPKEGNFGLAVLSKSPLTVEQVLIDRENAIPALILKSNGTIGDFHVVLLHAHPPIGGYGTLVRDRYLETVSRHIAFLENPTLVCGDFNTAPWTSAFSEFLKISELSTPKGQKLPNTWPSSLILPRLPIDHCLSKHLKITKYSKGPDIGSDHYPLAFDLSHL